MTHQRSSKTKAELIACGVRAPILSGDAPDGFRPTRSLLSCCNRGQLVVSFHVKTGPHAGLLHCKSILCPACAPARRRKLQERLLEAMRRAKAHADDVVLLTLNFARPDGALHYREGAPANAEEAAKAVTPRLNALIRKIYRHWGGSRVSTMSERVECPCANCRGRPLLDLEADNGESGHGARPSLARHLVDKHGCSGVNAYGDQAHPRVCFYDADGVRRLYDLQIPARVHYFRVIEAHKDPEGWPHVHVILISRGLAAAVREAVGREGDRERIRKLRLADGSEVCVSDLLQEVGFGPKGSFEIPRSIEKAVGYVSKQFGALAGEVTKSSQAAFYNISGLRIVSHSRGFLPPEETSDDVLGVVIELDAPMPLGYVTQAAREHEKHLRAGHWIGTHRPEASGSQVFDRDSGVSVGRASRRADRATLFEIVSKSSPDQVESSHGQVEPSPARPFSLSALIWVQRFGATNNDVGEAAVGAFQEWNVPLLPPRLKSTPPDSAQRPSGGLGAEPPVRSPGRAVSSRTWRSQNRPPVEGHHSPIGDVGYSAESARAAHPSPRGRDRMDQHPGLPATERGACRSQHSSNGPHLLAVASPVVPEAVVGCRDLGTSGAGACGTGQPVTPGGLVQGGPRLAGGLQARSQTRGSVSDGESARRAPPGRACGPV